jgi:hypothetical protein
MKGWPAEEVPAASPKKKANGWSWREESNLQPAVYKTAALPIELRQLTKRNHLSRRPWGRDPARRTKKCRGFRPTVQLRKPCAPEAEL